MNNSLVLRAYIRESIQGLNEGAGLLLPFLLSNPPGLEKEDIRVKLLLGTPGAFVEGKEPDYVVIADNPGQNKLVIRRHSKSELNPAFFQRKLNAINLLPGNSILKLISASGITPTDKTVLLEQDTWWILDSDKSVLKNDLGTASPLKTGPGYFLVSRDINIITPQREYTLGFREKVDNFECALDSWKESVEIIKTKDVKSKEWVLAAACFYDYANSLAPAVIGTVVTSLLGATLGAAFGAVTTGPGAVAFASAGAKLGLTYGASLTDVALRGVAIYWAANNNKVEFLTANVVYCVIVLIFGSITAYTTKFLPAATGAAGSKVAIEAIQDVIKTTPALKKFLTTTVGSFISIISEFISNIAAAIVIGTTIRLEKEKIEMLLSMPALLEDTLKDSEAALKYHIENSFPARE